MKIDIILVKFLLGLSYVCFALIMWDSVDLLWKDISRIGKLFYFMGNFEDEVDNFLKYITSSSHLPPSFCFPPVPIMLGKFLQNIPVPQMKKNSSSRFPEIFSPVSFSMLWRSEILGGFYAPISYCLTYNEFNDGEF